MPDSETIESRVLAALRKARGGASIPQLSAALGIDMQQVRGVVEALVERDLVWRAGVWLRHTTEDGRRYRVYFLVDEEPE